MTDQSSRREHRRHLGWLAVVASTLLAVAGWSLAAAQDQKTYPIFTTDNFVASMKSVGLGFRAANRLLEKGDRGTAKAQFIRTREQLAMTMMFWRDRQMGDAIKMLRSAVIKLDEIDDALSKEEVDPVKVNALVKQMDAACQACHELYREQDSETKTYRFKGLREKTR